MNRPLVVACVVASVGCFAAASLADESPSKDAGWDTHRHQLGLGVGAGFTYAVRASHTPGVTLDYAYASRTFDVGAQLRSWAWLPAVGTVVAPGVALHFHSHATEHLPVEFRLNSSLGGLVMWQPMEGHLFGGWQASLGVSARWWITERLGVELGPEGQLGNTNGHVNTSEGSGESVAFLGVCGWASAVYTL